MSTIEIMSEALSNKIAAGEVIERPASVVKELVENSIDAGSSRIEVHVAEGGLSSIKVIDNGRGMDRADASLAFARHATSKLKDDKELFRIMTLGFRGEALPSISSVSHVTLQTWDGEADTGTEVRLEGGKVIHVTDAPLRQGTRIEVTDLFYNTPARYKYLKTIHTELSHIIDYINRLALAHPKISFLLSHNGRELLKTNGQGERLQVLAAIYGASIAKQMLPFSAEHIDFEVSGYLTKPDITRSNRQYLSIFINGRYLKNYAISQAILKAYHTLLPVNRYPIVMLSINMDPSLIDINVHPAKLEARVSKEAELTEWLEAELKKTLHQAQLIPSPLRQLKIKQPVVVQEQLDLRLPLGERREWGEKGSAQLQENKSPYESDWTGERSEDGAIHRVQNPVQYQGQQEAQTDEAEPEEIVQRPEARVQEPMESVHEPMDRVQEPADSVHGPMGRTQEPIQSEQGADQPLEQDLMKDSVKPQGTDQEAVERLGSAPSPPASTDIPPSKAKIPLLSPLGQLHGTYILAQNEDGLYMIDQHAAQERIWYEYFYQQLNQPARANQELLIPLVLEFTASEYSLMEEHLSFLEQIGLKFEEFGYHSYMLRSHPHWFPEGEEEALVREIVELITHQKKQLEWIYFREKVAIMMSCKQAIKANHFLSYAEMEALLERLRTSSNPFTCPHGRPITVLLSKYDIEKMFKRVM